MRFQITDVGRIRKADIKLDGITVIAGENILVRVPLAKRYLLMLMRMGIWSVTLKKKLLPRFSLQCLLLSSMVSGGILVLCVLSSI